MTNEKELMDSVFKFRVGECVVPRILFDASVLDVELNQRADYRRVPVFTPLMIVERWLQECHGGIQKFYYLRGTTKESGFSMDMLKLTEMELISNDDAIFLSRSIAAQKTRK